MWVAAALSWTGHLDDLPPIGEILVGWPRRPRKGSGRAIAVGRMAHFRPSGSCGSPPTRRLSCRWDAMGCCPALVGFRGMREALADHGRPGRRCLRIGGCTPLAGRLRPQAVRGGLTSPRASAMARGVGHLHESTVTGGHHDGPDTFTPLLLPSAHPALLPDSVPSGRRTGGRAQPAPADRRPGIGCTGRSGPPPLTP